MVTTTRKEEATIGLDPWGYGSGSWALWVCVHWRTSKEDRARQWLWYTCGSWPNGGQGCGWGCDTTTITSGIGRALSFLDILERIMKYLGLGQHGGREEYPGWPCQNGGTVKVEVESSSSSRSSPRYNCRLRCIWSPFFDVLDMYMKLRDKIRNGTDLSLKFIRVNGNCQNKIKNLPQSYDTIFWSIGPCISFEPIRVESVEYARPKHFIISSHYPCQGLGFFVTSVCQWTITIHRFMKPQFLVLNHISTIFQQLAFFWVLACVLDSHAGIRLLGMVN